MILKGNQRGGGRQLAAHLLNLEDNEHVYVHETRGFISEDLPGAFHEAYAVSRSTKARQYLFSLSLNPPHDAKVSTAAFENAIDRVEERLGLANQPRAIVFHEKEGRRHAHAVWSRIDAETMTAINLAHTKLKLREVSRALYFEHGWQMPRGMVDSQERDPATYTHAEWQQAKRAGHDPKALKSMFQECWAISDTGSAFAQALAARGYTLALGDRRGHVAVDVQGEVYAVAKFVGVKAKDLRDKLGEPDALPSVTAAKHEIAGRMTEMLRRHVAEVRTRQRSEAAALATRRADIVERQRRERDRLDQGQAQRRARLAQEQQQRRRSGVLGLWDRVTGQRARDDRHNENAAYQLHQRDQIDRDQLIFDHIEQRKSLHREGRLLREQHAVAVVALYRDIGSYGRMRGDAGTGRGLSSGEGLAPGARVTSPRQRNAPGDRER